MKSLREQHVVTTYEQRNHARPGQKFHDHDGRKYIADKNGALRRVALTDQGPMLVRPWSKAERKRIKRQHQRARARQ